VYTNKAGKVAEGCATFWRQSRYRLAAQKDLSMRQIFAAAASPDADASGPRAGPATPAGPHARFSPLLRALPDLAATLQKVGTIAQVLVFVPAGRREPTSSPASHADANGAAPAAWDHGPTDHPAATSRADASCATAGVRLEGESGVRSAAEDEQALCVVNTHMFYHPWAPHVRILHVAAMVEEAVALAEGAREALALPSRPALLFCGDLNSDHSWGMPGASAIMKGMSAHDPVTKASYQDFASDQYSGMRGASIFCCAGRDAESFAEMEC
jgi:2',5'-phosphodiesterase